MERATVSTKETPASANAMSLSPLHNRGAGLLQRKCACGGTPGPTGECEVCKKKRLSLQTKLKVNKPGDIYEQEADRIADQVMATRADHAVSSTPVRIQRFAGQSTGQRVAVPASVDQALANPGRLLEPMLRQDMKQRFGYDFSRVRVHSDAAAEQSARDVNADAYTVGNHIVFGSGRFAPAKVEGRRLLAHELTHVVQQESGATPMIARQKSSFWEKASVVWHVGALAGHRAQKLAEEALAAARQTGLPGVHNGPADAWRHCYWNCRMTDVIGKEDAEFISQNHEEYEEANPTNERMMDTWNNEEGRGCSGDCDSCCQNKLDTGKLWTLEDQGTGRWGGKVQHSKPTPRAGKPSGEKYEKY